MLKWGVLLCVTLAIACAAGDDVVQLTAANFDSTVLKSDEPWLVEFYGREKNIYHCVPVAPSLFRPLDYFKFYIFSYLFFMH